MQLYNVFRWKNIIFNRVHSTVDSLRHQVGFSFYLQRVAVTHAAGAGASQEYAFEGSETLARGPAERGLSNRPKQLAV